ncbi:MAG: hypothetical protein AABY63_00745, partial [candidate division NC10 bacterium]
MRRMILLACVLVLLPAGLRGQQPEPRNESPEERLRALEERIRALEVEVQALKASPATPTATALG